MGIVGQVDWTVTTVCPAHVRRARDWFFSHSKGYENGRLGEVWLLEVWLLCGVALVRTTEVWSAWGTRGIR